MTNRNFPVHLKARWEDTKGLIQVFMGPRQVGKTTAALNLIKNTPFIYASADLPTIPDVHFIKYHLWKK